MIYELFSTIAILLLIAVSIVVVILLFLFVQKISDRVNKERQEAAGRAGEHKATEIISSVLREGDFLFTNVQISYDGKEAELDNVVINKHGVFIIEVKSYSGWLTGAEEDYEWKKHHVSRGGNVYTKIVKNPIKQVKRQVYILANYLDYYGVKVWVDGYAMILGASSPVASNMVLESVGQIDNVIHSTAKNGLSEGQVQKVCELLR